MICVNIDLRYMDDILMLTSTRNQLRQSVQVVNHLLEELELQKHPDKTMLGRYRAGFHLPGKALPAQ